MSTLRVEALEQPDGTAFVFNNKNLLINGGMNIFQRSTSTSVSTDIYSTVDRWKTRVNTMGVFTISRSTDVPSEQGFGYSTKWDCTTADASPAAGDFLQMQQRIEGQNLQHLLKGTSSAKAITLSFWVKSNKTGTYIASFYDADNARRISKSYTIDSASTWEKKEITFDGDTTGTLDNDNAGSLYLELWLGAGSTYTSGTLATSWESNTAANVAVGQVNLADSTSNELYITGCQMEIGSTASGFEFEPYEAILRKCERYFIQYGGGNIQNWICLGSNVTSTVFDGIMEFPTSMRTSPTFSVTGSWNVYDGSIDTTSNWISFSSDVKLANVRATTSSQTVGNCSRVYANNDINARFKFDAEL